MRFITTELAGAYAIEIERLEDERGFFARSFCRDEFLAHGLSPIFVQCNISFNVRKGTLRGMHYQEKPQEEAKLVRCTRGAIYDVVVDLRRGSPTFRRWASFELTADNRRMLYVVPGLAHGFQTLHDDSEVFYQMSEMYRPSLERGVRWNDPAFAIRWPLPDPLLSRRDASYPDFEV
jgi:dTDP-4-dehydrorhamnose 3,5-epimerase